MKIRGICRIEFIDSRTGEQTREPHVQQNLITNYALKSILDIRPQAIAYAFYPNQVHINISTQTTIPTQQNFTVTGVIATGGVVSGVTSPKWYESVSPPFGEIQEQIGFLTSGSRTFNTVLLSNQLGTNTSYSSPQTVQAIAYLLLTTPCVQEAFQYLNIYYRIEFLNVLGQGFSNKDRFINNFGASWFGLKSCHTDYTYITPFNIPSSATQLLYKDYYASPYNSEYSYNYNSVNTALPDYYAYKYRRNFSLTDLVGVIFNSWLYGLSNVQNNNYGDQNLRCCYGIDATTAKNTPYVTGQNVYQPPFQNLLRHGNGSTVPFLDSSNNGSGSGKLTLLGAWTNQWPEFYQLLIGGTTSSPTFRFRVRNWLKFAGNSYTDDFVSCPYWHPLVPAAPGMHGWRPENNDPQRFSATQVVLYDLTGVTLLNLFNGDFQSWDSTTTPAIATFNLRQVCVDEVNKLIYCGDRSGGIFQINPATNTVTQVSGSPCYGLDVGKNGLIWAITQAGLLNSSNWTTPVIFIWAGLTDNLSRAYWLRANPDVSIADNQILIGYDDGSGNISMVWRGNSSVSAAPSYVGAKKWPSSVDVSDTGSHWATQSYRLTFGSTTTTYHGSSPPGIGLNSSIYGNDNYFKITFWNDYLIGQYRAINVAGQVVNYSDLGQSSFVLHMVGGIVCLQDRMRCVGDNALNWTEYGWNGSAWVTGNTTDYKAIALDSPQALTNGISVTFSAGTSPPNFNPGEFYTFPVCYGIVKDNTRTYQYQRYWYSKPAILDATYTATIPSGTVPQLFFPAASDPTFVTIQLDGASSLISATINGVPVPTYYTAGEPPGPGEISLSANGAIVFNAGDAGKSFVCSRYCWISNG